MKMGEIIQSSTKRQPFKTNLVFKQKNGLYVYAKCTHSSISKHLFNIYMPRPVPGILGAIKLA